MDDVETKVASPAVPPQVDVLARMVLATHEFGLIASDSIDGVVGAAYTENSVIATLGALQRCGTLRPRDLDRLLGLSSPQVARVVDRLEATGDVERRAGTVAADQRAVELRLTPAGRRRTRRISEALFADTAPITMLAKQAVSHIAELGDGDSIPDGPVDVDRSGLGERLACVGLELQAVLRDAADDVAGALALFSLAVDGGRGRPSDVSERVGLTSGGTTKVIDRLESAGFVERSFGSNRDRRAVELRLTPGGLRQLDRMAAELRPHLPELRRLFGLVITSIERRTG